MKLQAGTTYKVTHIHCPNCVMFVTCLGEKTHMNIYDTHDEYYRNTNDLERVFEENNFELTEILV